jgi:hypothetical protein
MSSKRARISGGGSKPGARVRLNRQLYKLMGGEQRYCNGADILELLLAKGLCTEVETFEVEVQKFGDSKPIKVELDSNFNTMAEVQRVVEREDGTPPWEVQLYRVEESWDGKGGSSAQEDAALLKNDAVFSGPCVLQLVRQGTVPSFVVLGCRIH